MTTYLTLNFVALLIIFLTEEFGLRRPRRQPIRRFGLVLAALLIMTAVFDSLIVGLDIVAYDPAKILGIYVGRAPVEDFAYAVGAALLLPRLWQHFTLKQKDK